MNIIKRSLAAHKQRKDSKELLQSLRMVKVVLYGGMGAILNCAIALHSSPLSLNTVVNDLLLEPFSVIKTLLFLPAALGFLIGTVVMIAWTFMRAFVIRSLLQYNGWFLTPRNPINKVYVNINIYCTIICVYSCGTF